MDYVTPAMMELARQLRDTNLNWPYGTGDHFCTPANQMQICLAVKRDGESVFVCSHGAEFPLKDVAWLPKRTQALEWRHAQAGDQSGHGGGIRIGHFGRRSFASGQTRDPYYS